MWRKCAVMTERWRLVGGAELFDVTADPGQQNDVADEHPEVVAELRRAYEGWWKSLEPEFDDYVRIAVGGAENPVELMSHDWHTNDQGTPWHQNHVRRGFIGNGPWAVDIRESGRYDVTLRRWPAQLDRAMECVGAKVTVGGVEMECELEPSAKEATFRVTLAKGPAMLVTTLRRPDGKEHGAYFASIVRVE